MIMAADPTADELTAMVDAKAVLDWAGYAVDDLAETTVPGSFLKHLGLQPTSLPRIAGMFSEDDLEAMLTTWTVPPATSQSTNYGRIWDCKAVL